MLQDNLSILTGWGKESAGAHHVSDTLREVKVGSIIVTEPYQDREWGGALPRICVYLCKYTYERDEKT